MATKSIGKVTIRDGKLKRVHKVSASKKIGMKAKANRDEKKWRAKSK